MSNAANVKVIARFRPMNELEKTSGNEQVCVFTSPTSLQFNSTREKNVYRYNFDRIFTPSSTQEDIYSFGVKEIIDSVLNAEEFDQTEEILHLAQKYMKNKEDTKENNIKLIKYLMQKGFEYETIKSVLKSNIED